MIRRALLVAATFIAALTMVERPASAQVKLAGAPAPEIAGGPWINSAPLTMGGLKGRVVFVEFWTYG